MLKVEFVVEPSFEGAYGIRVIKRFVRNVILTRGETYYKLERG